MRDIDDLSVIVNGRAVARVIINHDKLEATRASCEAAYHLSTPGDIQFCTFSDGSQGRDNRGGAALAYQYPWLPHGWDPEDQATAPNENMVHKAWAFEHATTSLVMEGVGVLESLCAANDELKRHLPVLKRHASTVNVKAITDSQTILRYIPTGLWSAARTFPPQLIEKMRELILAMQVHGIKVNVELHWCPRNAVPPLCTADALANKAMNDGRGFCNVTENIWYKATQSVIMKELEPMVWGAVRFNKAGKKKTRRGKKKITDKAAEAAPTTAANTRSHYPSTEAINPLKPAAMSNAGHAMPTSAAQTTSPSTMPTVSVTAHTQPPKAREKSEARKRQIQEVENEASEGEPIKKVKLSPAETGKRQTEVEEMEDSERKPNKEAKGPPATEKAKTSLGREASPTAQPEQQLARTMPASPELDPDLSDLERGCPGQIIPLEFVPLEISPEETTPKETITKGTFV